jgi:hypothetical protein
MPERRRVTNMADLSVCEWVYNDEFDRWDTGCDDVIVHQNGETPKAFGFKFCPYCGKVIAHG